uniref:NADH dehydrogenase subunit 4 n=1 Tax=Piagetiella africana TaxID=2965260 RepID=UPI00286C91CF|nr:NADH dehydrogenase subunit 4 [Piagetiella africana]WKF19584.1 NADH dehydrogenase subunit 4 [Piagetiella africana]
MLFCAFLTPLCFLCEHILSELLMIFFILSFHNIFNGLCTVKVLGFWMISDNFSILLMMTTLWICSLMLLTMSRYQGSKKKKGVLLTIFLMTVLFSMFHTSSFIIFFFLFELSMIPTILMILFLGYQPERIEASLYFFFFTSIPSAGLIVYYLLSNQNMAIVYSSFHTNELLYLMIFSVFLVKTPLYFVHFWLPKAHVEAPVAGSMILAGILLKMGGYGMIRMLNHCYSMNMSIFFMSVSLWGMILACIMCFLSFDLKLIVAYSSVSHMNFFIASLMTAKMFVVFSGLLMMISHAFTSSGMFFMSDLLYKRSNSRSLFINKSLISVSPSFSFWWIVFCILNMSFPMTAGNVSEIFLSLVILKSYSLMVLIMVFFYFFFSAYYSVYIYYSINHGFSKQMVDYSPLDLKEIFIIICHAIPCLLMYFMSFVVMT